MHRIDGDGATPGNLFTEGNPATSTPATVVTDDWLNAVQEEVCNFIEGQGITLLTSGTDTYDQLDAALKKLIRLGGETFTATIANNTGPADVGGAGELEWDESTTKAVFMKYHIWRRTDSNSVLESGELRLAWDTENSAWVTPEWTSNFDDSGVTFSISSAASVGKLQYTSNDLTGTSYSGTIKVTDVKVIEQ